MPGRRVGGILPRCAYSADLEIRKRLQGRNMGDRCKPTARICPDDSYADLVSVEHEIPLLIDLRGKRALHNWFEVALRHPVFHHGEAIIARSSLASNRQQRGG